MSGRAPPASGSAGAGGGGRQEQQQQQQSQQQQQPPRAAPGNYGASTGPGGIGRSAVGRPVAVGAAAAAGAYGGGAGGRGVASLDPKQQQPQQQQLPPSSQPYASSRAGGGISARPAVAASLGPSPSPPPPFSGAAAAAAVAAAAAAADAAAARRRPPARSTTAAAASFSLRTNGDLFCVTDQDMEEPLVRGVPCVADTGAGSQAAAESRTADGDDDDDAAAAAASAAAAAAAAATAAAALAPLARPAVVPACSPAWNQARPFLSAGLQLLLDGEPVALEAGPGSSGGGGGTAADGEAAGPALLPPHDPPAPPTRLAAERAADPPPDFRAVPLAAQEAALVDDLLYAFMGVEGRYARCAVARGPGPGTSRGPRVAFFLRAPPGLDPALAEQARRLLPVAEHAVAVQRFVETRGGLAHGSVAQALAAAMRGALEEWMLFVTQLEHAQRRQQQQQTRGNGRGGGGRQQQAGARAARGQQQLQQQRRASVGGGGGGGSRGGVSPASASTDGGGGEGPLGLAALTYHLACGPAASMELLARVAADAASAELSAAALLDALAARAAALSGDARGRALAGRLLGAAAEPYLRMLGRWLREGVLDDPYCEFMVQEDARVAAAGREALVRAAAVAAGRAGGGGGGGGSSGGGGSGALADGRGGAAHAPGLDSAFWTQRFTLRHSPTTGHRGSGGGGNGPDRFFSSETSSSSRHDVPRVLAPLAAAVLATGRDLNAIRDCGRAVPRPVFPPGAALRLDPMSDWWAAGCSPSASAAGGLGPPAAGACAAAVRAARDSASAALLAVVVRDAGLPAWLRSLKRFFLHERADLVLALLQDGSAAGGLGGGGGGIMGRSGGGGGGGGGGDGDALAAELARPARDARRPRLQALLDAAVRSSSVASDPHADELSFVLDRRSLMELVRAALGGGAGGGARGGGNDGGGAGAGGADAAAAAAASSSATAAQQPPPPQQQQLVWQQLLLTVEVGWPVSLVVGRRQLLQYQALSKLLFSLRHAERSLLAARSALVRPAARGGGMGASCPPSSRPAGLTHDERAALRPWHVCCQALLFCVQEVLRYALTDVIEPAWRRLDAAVSPRRGAAPDVDALARAHASFLASALSGCLLSSPALLRRVVALQEAAEEFAALVRALVVLLPSPAAGEGGAGSAASGPAARARAATAAEAPAVRALRALAVDLHAAARLRAIRARLAREAGALASDLGERHAALLRRSEAALSGEEAGGGGGGEGGEGGGGGSGGWSAAGEDDVVASREDLEALLNLAERLALAGGEQAAAAA